MSPKLTLPMMPFYVRDYLAATRHMTLAERGAYTDLLLFSWDSGAPIPKDPTRIAALIGCNAKTLAIVWPAIRAKLIETNDRYISERLEAERRKAYESRITAHEKALRAGNANAERLRSAREASASSISPSSSPSSVVRDLGDKLKMIPPTPYPPKKESECHSVSDSERKCDRPAGPAGQRSHGNGSVDEDDPAVQANRLKAAELAQRKP